MVPKILRRLGAYHHPLWVVFTAKQQRNSDPIQSPSRLSTNTSCLSPPYPFVNKPDHHLLRIYNMHHDNDHRQIHRGRHPSDFSKEAHHASQRGLVSHPSLTPASVTKSQQFLPTNYSHS
ncbi:hypothetical protein B0T16DRAFT_29562 [Cercophora newfieldiana]|uniref:Uncharacterized protein n=1 Tax=Cercophora newfieldiana TaxID=92897 RepID=A0AA39YP48_9PEZI|nr:hypothetical protein B0T16DRAFT_29562 [Cercophora newfieldiana]